MSLSFMSLLRRRSVAVPLAGMLVLLLAWWFAWMSPEGTKLASVRQQQVTEQQTDTRLMLQLAALRADAARVKHDAPFLKSFAAAIPSAPGAPDLVVAVYRLATQDGVELQSITDDTVSSSGLGYSTVPVALSVSGPHDALLSFVSGLYGLPRLLTIQSISLSGTGNLNASSSALYTASISATAYTTYLPKPVAGGA